MSTTRQGHWGVVFFKRVDRRARPSAPGLEFLNQIPDEVEAEFMATLDAVAAGPPPSFRGGLRYQPMHAPMTGWHEVRVKRKKQLYRLFVLQDRKAPGLERPVVAIITGGVKPTETAFTDKFYAAVRELGAEYLASDPRTVL